MDDEDPRQFMPWEQKVAIGCLALLSLQGLHDLILVGLGSGQLGAASLGPLSPLLLFLVLLAGFGILKETRKGWWSCFLIMTVLGFAHLALFWGLMRSGVTTPETVKVGPGIGSTWTFGLKLTPF